MCYNLPLQTHDADHSHRPQILKIASGTHIEWILKRNKKYNDIHQKIAEKLIQRKDIHSQMNSRLSTATN